MTYNIHPIFVHFPIALLFVYSLLKIIPLKRWFPAVSWKDIERVFLVIGVLGAIAALSTGETAEYLVRPNHALVEAHSFFGSLATWIYGALLAGEASTVFSSSGIFKRLPISIQKIISILARVLAGRILSVILAVLGLVTISITGMLGGIIVYGTAADPLAGLLLKILGISL